MEVDTPKSPNLPTLSLAEELARADETGTNPQSGALEDSCDSNNLLPDIVVEETAPDALVTTEKNVEEREEEEAEEATDAAKDDVEGGEASTEPNESAAEVETPEKESSQQAKSVDDDSSSSVVELENSKDGVPESQGNKETENNDAMVVDDVPEMSTAEILEDSMNEDVRGPSGETVESGKEPEAVDPTVNIEQADDNASTSLVNGESQDKDTSSTTGTDDNSTSLPAVDQDPFASSEAIMDVDASRPETSKTPAVETETEPSEIIPNAEVVVANGDATPVVDTPVETTTATTSTATTSTSTPMALDDDEPGELVIAEKPPPPTEIEVIVPEEDTSAVVEPTAVSSIVGTISVANLTGRMTVTSSAQVETSQLTSTPSSPSKVIHPRRGSPCKIEEVIPPVTQECTHCNIRGSCRKKVTISGVDFYLCSDKCVQENRALCKATTGKTIPINVQTSDLDLVEKKCSFCKDVIPKTATGCITWEVMEFCNEDCLGKYQSKFTNVCVNCEHDVVPASMGKYCVRFSHEVKQFCSTTCLDTYKKNIKTCSFCQKNLNDSPDSFLAPVRGIDQFKDFCSQNCLEKYDCITNNLGSHLSAQDCVVCRKFKIVQFEVVRDQETETLCSEVCLSAYKFVNSIDIGSCSMCNKFYDRQQVEECCVFNGVNPMTFCSQHCMNINVLSKRLILPCAWCKAKKYNFDMVRKRVINDAKQEENLFVCSLNCLALFSVSATQVEHSNQAECCHCKKYDYVQYHLTMSDMSIRNFCSYGCVAAFQKPYQSTPNTVVQPIPTGTPKRSGMLRPTPLTALQSPAVVQQQALSNAQQEQNSGPMISSVTSLKRLEAPPPLIAATPKAQPSKQLFKYPVLIKPRDHIEVKNKWTSCRVAGVNKGVSCKPNRVDVSTQYDPETPDIEKEDNDNSSTTTTITADTSSTTGQLKALIPVPVPIYVPTPMAMYTLPSPVILPVPFPVPVPVFVPTTLKTTKRIFKLLKKIQEKLPENPVEADVFMRAAMAAAECNKEDQPMDQGDDHSTTSRLRSTSDDSSSSSSSDEGDTGEIENEKKAKEDEKRQKRKTRRTSSMSTDSSLTQNYDDGSRAENGIDSSRLSAISEDSESASSAGKSSNRHESSKGESSPPSPPVKKRRRDPVTSSGDLSTPEPDATSTSAKKPKLSKDSSMKLKYMLGVNAWKYFVCYKEKSGTGKKLTADLLTMRPEELNSALALFMREAKMPSGGEFRGDSKYYLLLGIQYYLFEHGRKINIFHDPVCESLTDALEEDAIKFNSMYRKWESTRLEEDHLWESKQLGVSSPEVLISTLIYFNTLHFGLLTVEDHQKLSFKTVVKHLKDSDSSSKCSALRFYPPPEMAEADPKRKDMYEIEESANKKRCHVHLFDFYLTKCPEVAKQRGDLFYLLPEAACSSESPVWYSNVAITHEHIRKVLNRIKMIKEIKQMIKDSK